MLAAEMNSVHQTGASMPPSSQRQPKRDLESLVQAIRANDNDAWVELVGRFDRTLRAIARSYRLSAADVDDVLQTVWLRLHQCLDRLRDPNAVGAWLTTTTRRTSLDVMRKGVREQLTDDLELLETTDCSRPDAALLAAERNDVLQRALGSLPAHQRRLMVLLATTPTDYRQISARLDMPIGSIGPTRARSLDRLSQNAELRDLHLVSC
jgi:RNA polymerase sigma factor (sigma-70 family)